MSVVELNTNAVVHKKLPLMITRGTNSKIYNRSRSGHVDSYST